MLFDPLPLISQSSGIQHSACQISRSLILMDAIGINGINIDTIQLSCDHNGDFPHLDIHSRRSREAPQSHRR